MDACSSENNEPQEDVIFNKLSNFCYLSSTIDDDAFSPMKETKLREFDAFSDSGSNKRLSGRTTSEHSADVYTDDDDRCSSGYSDKDEEELLSPLSCNNNDHDGVNCNSNNDSDSMYLEYDSFLEYSSAIDNNNIVQDDIRDKRRKSMGASLGMGSGRRNDPMLDLRVLAQLTMMKNIIRVLADELHVEPRGLLSNFEVGSLSPDLMNKLISLLREAIQKNIAHRLGEGVPMTSLVALSGGVKGAPNEGKEVL